MNVFLKQWTTKCIQSDVQFKSSAQSNLRESITGHWFLKRATQKRSYLVLECSWNQGIKRNRRMCLIQLCWLFRKSMIRFGQDVGRCIVRDVALFYASTVPVRNTDLPSRWRFQRTHLMVELRVGAHKRGAAALIMGQECQRERPRSRVFGVLLIAGGAGRLHNTTRTEWIMYMKLGARPFAQHKASSY